MIRARGVLGIGPLSPSRQIILTPALQAYIWSFNDKLYIGIDVSFQIESDLFALTHLKINFYRLWSTFQIMLS